MRVYMYVQTICMCKLMSYNGRAIKITSHTLEWIKTINMALKLVSLFKSLIVCLTCADSLGYFFFADKLDNHILQAARKGLRWRKLH